MSDVSSLFSGMSPDQKLQLIGELWDDLSATPNDIPLHTWQMEELDRRKAHLEAHPESALTWDEIIERIRARYGS